MAIDKREEKRKFIVGGVVSIIAIIGIGFFVWKSRVFTTPNPAPMGTELVVPKVQALFRQIEPFIISRNNQNVIYSTIGHMNARTLTPEEDKTKEAFEESLYAIVSLIFIDGQGDENFDLLVDCINKFSSMLYEEGKTRIKMMKVMSNSISSINLTISENFNLILLKAVFITFLREVFDPNLRGYINNLYTNKKASRAEFDSLSPLSKKVLAFIKDLAKSIFDLLKDRELFPNENVEIESSYQKLYGPILIDFE